jgi:D-tagatose-1,6-bisphosphate aldolase subunit GatZ/KbaZ
MYLDEIRLAQERGEARGIFSVCSAHPYVICQTLKVSQTFRVCALIEATCNQVNQFGGYTGMKPADFVRYVRGIALENDFPFENVVLGGDHLGPSVWQNLPAGLAMRNAEVLVRDYVRAGFVKIHLDCSMPLSGDPPGALDVEVSAQRAAALAAVAESMGNENVRYVIGSEVPIPGGSMRHEEGVRVTRVEDVRRTLEVSRQAFHRAGLQSAWERVIAVVVQPGVEFGDDFILPYRPELAKELSQFIETRPLVYEAHSTDYQVPGALANLVRDHFAVLKVGPALTFAFREAAFALAAIEDELLPPSERSNLVSVLDEVMLQKPQHWLKYYRGDEEEKAFKRKYSLSDRIRYYWTDPTVERAFAKMLHNLSRLPLPESLLRQRLPDLYPLASPSISLTPETILLAKIRLVLDAYTQACNLNK